MSCAAARPLQARHAVRVSYGEACFQAWAAHGLLCLRMPCTNVANYTKTCFQWSILTHSSMLSHHLLVTRCLP